jgi:hypothetical protein
MDAALRSARLAEAAHFEAVMNIRDAATLRLQVLKDELEPIVSARREAQAFIDLALVPGTPPRLWIDMVSAVVMAPDPRTYRFCQDTAGGQRVLFETTDRAEMVDKITAYIAHRLIDRQRQMSNRSATLRRRAGLMALGRALLAWLSGFLARCPGLRAGRLLAGETALAAKPQGPAELRYNLKHQLIFLHRASCYQAAGDSAAIRPSRVRGGISLGVSQRC